MPDVEPAYVDHMRKKALRRLTAYRLASFISNTPEYIVFPAIPWSDEAKRSYSKVTCDVIGLLRTGIFRHLCGNGGRYNGILQKHYTLKWFMTGNYLLT